MYLQVTVYSCKNIYNVLLLIFPDWIYFSCHSFGVFKLHLDLFLWMLCNNHNINCTETWRHLDEMQIRWSLWRSIAFMDIIVQISVMKLIKDIHLNRCTYLSMPQIHTNLLSSSMFSQKKTQKLCDWSNIYN